jgi:2-polyprenyl-6-methoxyphenol hydroxylase-like FAD-dependent oxidoreductase
MPRILIAGGGVGGLALAQALRRDDLDVAVYERDPTARTRNQGYRIHIDRNGNEALRACLPAGVFDLVRRTSGARNDLVAAYTHRLEPVMAQTFPEITDDDITHVDRNAFRQAMLTGLADHVHFGRTVVGYRVTDSGRVRVEFDEGGSDEGDLLVGADGAGSAVRRRLLPHATLRDLGLWCVYGRMTITETTGALIPEDFNRGFCWVADGNRCGVAFAPVRFRTPPEGMSDYLMTALVATPDRLGVRHGDLPALPPDALWKVAVQATADWHPVVRDLLAQADADTFFPIAIRAGRQVDAWKPGPVTLLGDAVHTLPPTGGVGANTALRDSAALAAEIRMAARGEKPLVDAVAAYERVMLPRGLAAVDASLRMAGQLFGNDGTYS